MNLSIFNSINSVLAPGNMIQEELGFFFSTLHPSLPNIWGKFPQLFFCLCDLIFQGEKEKKVQEKKQKEETQDLNKEKSELAKKVQ